MANVASRRNRQPDLRAPPGHGAPGNARHCRSGRLGNDGCLRPAHTSPGHGACGFRLAGCVTPSLPIARQLPSPFPFLPVGVWCLRGLFFLIWGPLEEAFGYFANRSINTFYIITPSLVLFLSFLYPPSFSLSHLPLPLSLSFPSVDSCFPCTFFH